jgi:hypothetical protein
MLLVMDILTQILSSLVSLAATGAVTLLALGGFAASVFGLCVFWAGRKR